MALLYMERSMTSTYLLSPVARNILWLNVVNIKAAHVSAYADTFGREYGSPKPSFPVEPMPPVMYSFVLTASCQIRLAARKYSWSPASMPTSTIDTINDAQFTA